MSGKTYMWNGAPAVLDLWSEGSEPPTLILSAHVAPGQTLPVALDPAHSVVASWLAFKLIAEAPAIIDPQPPADTARLARSRKETLDG